MDEPEKPDERPGLLPALLLAWVVLYLCMVLVMWWYTCRHDADPMLALRIHAIALGSLALLFLWGTAGAPAEVAAAAEPEAWLCQHCLKPYVPGAHFCPRCGAPKTFYSGTAEYQRIYAQAWIVGKAARYPSRRLHLVGMCLIAGPGVLGTLAVLLSTALHVLGEPSPSVLETAGFVSASFLGLLWTALLVICAMSWRRRARGVQPPQPEIEYGAPPWFTYDAQWALPEFEREPADDGPV